MIDASAPSATALLAAIVDLDLAELGALQMTLNASADDLLATAAGEVGQPLIKLARVQRAFAGLVAAESFSRLVDDELKHIVSGGQ